MDRFHAIQTFVTVAEHGGFAAAARALGMSPPAVTRAVAGLEERLGSRLFVRTTRSVRLTESGAQFLASGRRLLQDLAEAEEGAAGRHAAPRGELRITAPVLFGRQIVTPLLIEFMRRYPEVSCQALFVDRVVNLMEEGIDAAIRIGELPDSSLIARRVGSVRHCVFASPDYLKAEGTPKHPRDLAKHRLIQPLATGGAASWRFRENGKTISVPARSRLSLNTNDAIIEAALQGWGISRLLSYQLEPYVKDRRLRFLLKKFEPPPLPVHIVHPEGKLVSARVRAFADHMAAGLQGHAALTG